MAVLGHTEGGNEIVNVELPKGVTEDDFGDMLNEFLAALLDVEERRGMNGRHEIMMHGAFKLAEMLVRPMRDA